MGSPVGDVDAGGRELRQAAGGTRLPGLDGLRALAVAAVLAYHLDAPWLPGGFLGVDVFLVVSGYLICWLLLAEQSRSGAVSLRAFWGRRARRLLPALLVLLPVVAVATAVSAPDAVDRLRADVVAALTYCSNWWQLVAGQSYVEDIGRPPVLRHLWSLALEEQFYLAFPPLLVLALRRGWSRSRLAGVAAGLAIASAGAMALLFRPGTDPSRVYYGTDTRSAALFVGVALALLLPPAEVARMPRRLLTAVGAIGLLGVATCAATFGERSTALYRGGFLLAAGFTGLAVLALTVEGPLSRLLGWEPLRWAGTRSYAIYLWHWPVIALTRPEVDLPLSGPPLLGLRLGVTLALAELSWRLVERPVLAGAAGRWWRASRPNRSSAILAGTAVATLTAAVLVSVGPPPPPPLLRAALRHVEAPPTTLLGISTETTSTTVEGPAAEPVTTLPPEPQLVVPDVSAAPYDSFLAVGESVLLAARDTLGRASGGAAIVDAKIGRQVKDGLDALRTYRDRGDLGRVAAVVVHLGTNGRFTTAQFHQLADITKDVPRVVVVNVRVPREWEGESNATIAAGVPEHPNMRLVDWYDASRPRGVLSYDGIHPTRDGAKVYSRLVLDQLPPKAAPTTTTSAPPPPPETTTTLPPETTTTAPPETTTTTVVPVTLPA